MDKVTRLLAFGDFHANPFGEFSRVIGKNGESTLSNILIKTAGWIAQQYRSNKAELLLNNGDFSHTPGVLNAPTIKLISEVEGQFSGIPRVYNTGNHDMDGKVGLHNLELNRLIPGVVAIPEPSSVCWYGGMAILPFTYSAEEQETLLSSIPDGSVVVVHTPIKGIFMGSGVIESHGIEPELLRRFRLVIASHYHQPQIITPDKDHYIVEAGTTIQDLPTGTVVMMGTPCARSFNDQGKVYGAWYFEFGKKIKCKFLVNPHSPTYTNLNISSVEEFQEKFIDGGNRFYSVTGPKEVVDLISASNHSVLSSVRFRREKSKESDSVRDQSISHTSNSNIKDVIQKYIKTLDDSFLPSDEVDSFLAPLIQSMGDDGQTAILGGNIKFHRLSMANFLSWESAEIGFEGAGLTLISGANQDTTTANSNGSGKSSLLESMVWALYDTTFRELQNKDSVVRKGCDHCMASVVFSIADDRFTVTRERNKGKGSVSIVKNGVDISRGTANAVNAQIVSILGIPYEVFSMITLFGSSNPNRFTSLGDADRKKFLGMVFNLGSYELLRLKVKDKSTEYQKHRLSVGSKIQAISETINSISGRIVSQTEIAKQKEEAREGETIKLEENLSILLGSIENKENGFRVLEKSLLDNKEELLKLESNSLISLKHEKESRVNEVKNRLLVLERKKKKYDQDCSNKQNEIKNFKLTCPTCDQSLPQSSVNIVLMKYASELEAMQEESDSIFIEIENEKKSLSILVDELESIQSDLKSVSENICLLTPKIRQLETQKLTEAASLNMLKEELVICEKRISELKTHDYFASVRSLEESKLIEEERLKDQESKLSEILRNCSFSARIYDILGPKGVISYILDTGIQELNSYLESVSSGIFGDDYTISLSSTKELASGQEENRISIQYSTQAGGYGASSDGEKRKADIAIFLSLNCLASALGVGSTNLMIADEALDSLDFTAAKCVVDTISKFAEEESKKVFLISHSDNIVPFISDVLWVEKKGEISRIRN